MIEPAVLLGLIGGAIARTACNGLTPYFRFVIFITPQTEISFLVVRCYPRHRMRGSIAASDTRSWFVRLHASVALSAIAAYRLALQSKLGGKGGLQRACPWAAIGAGSCLFDAWARFTKATSTRRNNISSWIGLPFSSPCGNSATSCQP